MFLSSREETTPGSGTLIANFTLIYVTLKLVSISTSSSRWKETVDIRTRLKDPHREAEYRKQNANIEATFLATKALDNGNSV